MAHQVPAPPSALPRESAAARASRPFTPTAALRAHGTGVLVVTYASEADRMYASGTDRTYAGEADRAAEGDPPVGPAGPRLPGAGADHRRVLAVLAFLESRRPAGPVIHSLAGVSAGASRV
ncbi:hypothetical protein [Streptomyces sp. NPDC055013]